MKRTKNKKTRRKAIAVFFMLSAVLMLPYNIQAADKTLQDSDTLYHDISYEDELKEAVDVLSLGDISNVKSNLVLPYSYGIHVNISWKSSDEEVIDLKGKVMPSSDSDKEVTLTAALSSTKTEQTETKEFKVHVPKVSTEEILEQDAKTAHEYIDYILNDGYVLPDSDDLGIRSDITWELSSGEAEIKDKKLVKTDNSAERQQVQLKGLLTFEGQEKTFEAENIVLLDEYEGYILSYFAGKK